MTPSEKYGDEFRFDKLTLRPREGPSIAAYQACVCIHPDGNKEATLALAWHVARELARWLVEEFAVVPDHERFQIIVAWSRRVREHQGQIFKIWGYKDGMRQIASSESHESYALATGHTNVPMPRWEKDVFTSHQA